MFLIVHPSENLRFKYYICLIVAYIDRQLCLTFGITLKSNCDCGFMGHHNQSRLIIRDNKI